MGMFAGLVGAAAGVQDEWKERREELKAQAEMAFKKRLMNMQVAANEKAATTLNDRNVAATVQQQEWEGKQNKLGNESKERQAANRSGSKGRTQWGDVVKNYDEQIQSLYENAPMNPSPEQKNALDKRAAALEKSKYQILRSLPDEPVAAAMVADYDARPVVEPPPPDPENNPPHDTSLLGQAKSASDSKIAKMNVEEDQATHDSKLARTIDLSTRALDNPAYSHLVNEQLNSLSELAGDPLTSEEDKVKIDALFSQLKNLRGSRFK